MSPAKKKSSLRKKLLLTVAASFASLLACELALRLFVDVPLTPFLKEYDDDLRVAYKKDLDATIVLPEFTMEWSTDSRGFRGPRPPQSSKGCILILGDSYSEGWGVSNGEEFASLLRAALDKRYGPNVVPVINAAMSASGNGRWIKLLNTTLADYEPRLVLLQTCWNDSLDNYREKQYQLLGYRSPLTSTLTRSEVVERIDPPKPLVRKVQSVLESIPGLEQSHLFALVRNFVRMRKDRPYWQLDKDEPALAARLARLPPTAVNNRWLYHADHLFLALVEHSLAICHRRGWPTALISVRTGGARFDELAKLCQRFDTPLLDIRNREAHPEFYYEIDSHWNQAGHRDVADMILRRLLEPDSPYLHGLTPIEPEGR